VDETIELFDVVSISAGVRGLQILIAPADYSAGDQGEARGAWAAEEPDSRREIIEVPKPGLADSQVFRYTFSKVNLFSHVVSLFADKTPSLILVSGNRSQFGEVLLSCLARGGVEPLRCHIDAHDDILVTA
jgi:hypothetical protein